MAIVANEPADEGEQELSQGWMDVEEVCAFEVVGGKL